MTRFYLDTSIAVHALRGTPATVGWFDDTTARDGDSLASSRILQTELTRVLRRDGVAVVEREEILRHLDIVPLSEPILTAAEAVTEHITTLDRIHLASALALGSDTIVVSHDENVKRVTAVLGLVAYDPIG